MNLFTVVTTGSLLAIGVFLYYATSKILKASSVLHMDIIDYLRANRVGRKGLLAEKYKQELGLIKYRLAAIMNEQLQDLNTDEPEQFLLNRAITLLAVEWVQLKLKDTTVCILMEDECKIGSVFERVELDCIPPETRDRLRALLSVKFICSG